MMNTHSHIQAHTQSLTHKHTYTHTHTVGYSLWLWFVKVGREEGGAGEEEDKEEGRAALVVDLDCFLQVGVATSLWSFVEMIQP